MAERRLSWWKLAAILTVSGLLVGTVVAAVSVGTSAPLCAGGADGERCRDLVVTLARRAGIVAGFATLLMVLLGTGLVRMLAQDDRDRAQSATEASWASPSPEK